MPGRFPSICGCGKRVPAGATCECRKRANRETERRRPNARQRGYTSDWQIARAAFLTEHPACRMTGCSAPATVVDHIRPHKGDMARFWDRSNWQPLCARCHNRRKQSIEKRGDQ